MYKFGPFVADPVRRQLCREGADLCLTPKAFQTLMVLLDRRGSVVGKDVLLDTIWPDTAVEENNLTQQIATLRRALGEQPRHHRFVVTVPGEGYTFVADVQELRESEPDAVKVPGSPIARYRPLFAAHGLGGTLAAVIYIFLIVFPVVINGLVGPTHRRAQTVAVLPFRTASLDEQALGLGIRDTLRARLGSLDDVALRPARSSVPADDVLAAGKEMDANVVFSGSIQNLDGRVRVIVEMLDVANERVVWGKTFDYDRARHFELQDTIAVEAVSMVRSRS